MVIRIRPVDALRGDEKAGNDGLILPHMHTSFVIEFFNRYITRLPASAGYPVVTRRLGRA